MSKEICRNFVYKNCNNKDCIYMHDNSICFHYFKYKECKYGIDCKKTHLENTKGNVKGKSKDKYNKNKIRNKNTKVFTPMDREPDLRVVFDNNNDYLKTKLTTKDILIVPNMFKDFEKNEIYNLLKKEITQINSDKPLLKMWHGNDKIDGTHLIVDDSIKWKENCPTFNLVVEKIRSFFNMDIKATRMNVYNDLSQFKPFHFDASAVNPEKAKLQNFTVAVSFGYTRSVAFEREASPQNIVVSFPIDDSQTYCFTKDTNCTWRHGVLQGKNVNVGPVVDKDVGPVVDTGRISIVCWGYVNNVIETIL